MNQLTEEQEKKFQSLVDRSEETKKRVQEFLEDIDKPLVNNMEHAVTTLEKYKSQIHEKLQEQAIVFCTIGSGNHESPRYINVSNVFEENGMYYLRFASTQVSYIFFSIRISFVDFQVMKAGVSPYWDEMKRLRNEYLAENFPSISL